MTVVWAHLHLPRLRSGETVNVISLKVPGERIDYTSMVSLTGAMFRVSEPGRQRCIRDGVRNVHAWVVGDLGGRSDGVAWRDVPPAGFSRAVYDPWKGSSFVNAETLEPVFESSLVVMSGKSVFYWR